MSLDSLKLLRNDTADGHYRALLDRELARYNDEISHWHRDIRQVGGEAVDLFLQDDTGQVIAGLYGEIYWQSLEIDRLWVHAEVRHQGLGQRLLSEAEALARDRRCRFIHLTTFSFQAPEFYRQQGFSVCGEQADFPPGFSKIWLRKML